MRPASEALLATSLLALPGVALAASDAEFQFQDLLAARLVQQVPEVLATFDARTGRFGQGIWICTDQNAMYPLAVAYATRAEGNPHHKSTALLEAIIKAGDALIADADASGQWVFRKKDGSTWGKIYMPWTYSRWVRSFALIRDDMPADARQRWEKALTLGYTGISRSALAHVHNIPAHHAMGLYVAGQALHRPEWCEQAAAFLRKVAGQQSEGGYWSEGAGPVVIYNFVYMDALGTYYALSGDEQVLPALQKGAVFHRRFTYPSGEEVETIDQRNPFHEGVATGNVGFTFSPAGRAWLRDQWKLKGMDNLPADLIASCVLYGQEGPAEAAPKRDARELFVLTEGGVDRAAVLRQGPWFVCFSAYTAPISDSRWIQDRQNLVSIWHERIGLILGGGNTKLQPAWSNFTVGDMALLQHKAGDTQPDFRPKGELYHVPSSATLIRGEEPGLDLVYGRQNCRLRIRIRDERTLQYRLATDTGRSLAVAAHLTLIPHLKQPLETGGGRKELLAESPLSLTFDSLGGALQHAGWTLRLPEMATLHWPALPHNPYRKDGRAELGEGRIEVRIPLEGDQAAQTVTIEVNG
ncbi:MAG: hypothetical protein AMXMBFR13_32200 [Phycisphaerae bacterium]